MRKILIVEDEVKIAKLLALILAPLGKTQIAHDGGSGYVKYLKNRHDLIICDICMPVSDGLEMAAKIRALSPAVPIIALSAFSEKEMLLRAIDARVNKYLIKPANPDELIICARELLAAQTAECELASGAKIDFIKGEFICANADTAALSRRELEFLRCLANPLGRVQSIEQICALCWPTRAPSHARARTFIKRLRDKMGADAAALGCKNGAGYFLN